MMSPGIASSGKVVYFTAMFPYLVLTIFFFRGITLRGATAGLAHMFTPKVCLSRLTQRLSLSSQMEMLLKPTVWLDAANQVFYSFGLAFGSIISFGSYNSPSKNCVKVVNRKHLMATCNFYCLAGRHHHLNMQRFHCYLRLGRHLLHPRLQGCPPVREVHGTVSGDQRN